MVLDLRLSKDWDVEMTSFLFFTLFPTLFWTALRAFGTAFSLWPHLELFGTREALMERALAHLELSGTIWNARSALGTPAELLCIVRWQEILSPSYYPLARPKRYWNGPTGLRAP